MNENFLNEWLCDFYYLSLNSLTQRRIFYIRRVFAFNGRIHIVQLDVQTIGRRETLDRNLHNVLLWWLTWWLFFTRQPSFILSLPFFCQTAFATFSVKRFINLRAKRRLHRAFSHSLVIATLLIYYQITQKLTFLRIMECRFLCFLIKNMSKLVPLFFDPKLYVIDDSEVFRVHSRRQGDPNG